MRVKVIQMYNDLKLGKIKEPGEIVDVDKKRADTLIRKGFVESIKDKKTVKEEPEKK